MLTPEQRKALEDAKIRVRAAYVVDPDAKPKSKAAVDQDRKREKELAKGIAHFSVRSPISLKLPLGNVAKAGLAAHRAKDSAKIAGLIDGLALLCSGQAKDMSPRAPGAETGASVAGQTISRLTLEIEACRRQLTRFDRLRLANVGQDILTLDGPRGFFLRLMLTLWLYDIPWSAERRALAAGRISRSASEAAKQARESAYRRERETPDWRTLGGLSAAALLVVAVATGGYVYSDWKPEKSGPPTSKTAIGGVPPADQLRAASLAAYAAYVRTPTYDTLAGANAAYAAYEAASQAYAEYEPTFRQMASQATQRQYSQASGK